MSFAQKFHILRAFDANIEYELYLSYVSRKALASIYANYVLHNVYFFANHKHLPVGCGTYEWRKFAKTKL